MSIYHLTYIISTAVTFLAMAMVSFHSWRNRKLVAGADAFMLLSALLCLYSVFQSGVLFSSTPGEALTLFNLRFITLAFGPVWWIYFVFSFSGRKDLISLRTLLLLMVLPCITQAMIWTNDYHHLWVVRNPDFYRTGGFYIADTGTRQLGLWMKIHYIYSYLLALIGFAYYFYSSVRTHGHQRKQAVILGAGVFFMIAGSLFPAFSYFPGMRSQVMLYCIAIGSLVIAWGIRRQNLLEENPFINMDKKYPLALIGFFAVMTAGIISGAYINFSNFREYHLDDVKKQLSAISDLKIRELEHWRDERLNDGLLFYNNNNFNLYVRRFFADTADISSREYIVSWIEKFRNSCNYKYIVLCDSTGRRRMSLPGKIDLNDKHLEVQLQEVKQNNTVFMTDFHKDPAGDFIHISVIVPLREERSPDVLLGYLVMMVDPHYYIYPMLRSWPVASDTAETILVRPEGESILFLSEPRFIDNAAMNLALPAAVSVKPARRDANNEGEFTEGTDYRGEHVFASVSPVPNTTWFLAVKIDASEVYDPVKERFWLMVVIIFVFVSAAGAGTSVIWRRKSESFYRDQYESAQKLYESEEKFSKAFQTASYAMVISVPSNGCIVDVNDAFSAMTGYSYNEAVHSSALDLGIWSNPEDRFFIMKELLDGNSIRDEELMFRKKNGDTFTGLFSAELVTTGTGTLVVSSTNDITDRKNYEESLRESEERYRLTLENMIEGAQILDFEWRYIYINRAAEHQNRRPGREMLGQRYMDIWPGIETTEVFLMIERCLNERVSIRMENFFRFPDGEEGWYDLSIQPVPEGVFILSIDVTERKTAEEELVRAYDRLSKMTSSNVVGVIIADPSGRLLEVNDYYLDMIGYTRGDFNAGLIRWDSITPPEYAHTDQKAIEELRLFGRCTPYQKQYIKKDGSRVWVLLADVFLGGEQEEIFAIAINITDRKEAESALLQSEMKYRSLIEHSPDAIFINLDGRISFVNEACVTLFGAGNSSGLIGRNIFEVFHPDYHDLIRSRVHRLRDLGESVEPVEEKIIRLDGKSIDVEVTAAPFDYEGSNAIHVILRDITERKILQRKIEETLAGLEQTVAERTSALEKANRELESFSYSISHDLRAPLRHISGFIEMLRAELADSSNGNASHYIDVVDKAAKRMGMLIDDLLSFSRMGRAALQSQTVVMNELLNDVLDDFEDEFHSRGIIVMKGDLPDVKGDRAMLRVVLNNLISNAVKFSSKNETPLLEFGFTYRDGEGFYFVKDNGTGFDMSYSGKLFGVFSRLHTDSEYEGTGIGLAMVKSIIERHNGTVRAEGEKGKGACFYFSLPDVKYS